MQTPENAQNSAANVVEFSPGLVTPVAKPKLVTRTSKEVRSADSKLGDLKLSRQLKQQGD